MFAVQKLRHYMRAHIVRVISKANSIKYILYIKARFKWTTSKVGYHLRAIWPYLRAIEIR